MDFLFTHTPLKFFIQSFWRDEAFTSILSKNSPLKIMSLTAKDFNPPLYYIIMHYWIRLFGDSVISIRSFSLISYALTIIIIHLILEYVLKLKKIKLYFYTFLVAINPLLLYYAFEGRMYAFFILLTTLAMYLFLTKKHLAFAVVMALIFYVHYFSIFILISYILYIFIYQTKHEKKLWIKTIIAGFVPFIPWALYMLYKHPIIKESFWIKKPDWKTLINSLSLLYSGYEKGWYFDYKFLTTTSLLFLVLFIYGFFKTKAVNKKTHLLYKFILINLFTPLISVFVLSITIKPIFHNRYLAFLSIYISLLIIIVAELLKKNLKVIVLLIILFLTLYYNKMQIKSKTKINIQDLVAKIKDLSKPDDLIYVTDELNFHLMQTSFGRDKVFIYGKNYQRIPNYVGKILIPPQKVVYNMPIYPKRAFIIHDNLTYEIVASY